MMKKSKKRLVCFLAGAATLVAAFGFISGGFDAQAPVRADEYTATFTQTLQDKYYVNETIDLTGMRLEYGSNRYDVEQVTVIYPDGNAYLGKSFALTQVGEYHIICTAQAQDKKISATHVLTAYREAYSVTADGTCTYVDQISMVNNAEVAGLELTLNNGSVFTYNEAMDISKNGGEEPFVVLYPHTLSTINKMDSLAQDSAALTVVRLTDCNDNSRYVDFDISWDLSADGNATVGYSNYRRGINFRAGASNQRPVGLVPKTTPNQWYNYVTYGNSTYWAYVRPEVRANQWGPYGTTIGGVSQANCDNMGIGLYFNDKTGEVFAEYMGTEKRVFVTNLYSEAIYAKMTPFNTGKPFEGFTTGEVYLSIFGEEYYGNQLKVDVSSIFDREGSALNVSYAEDKQAPSFTESFNGEYTLVAVGEKIVVPTLATYDVSGVNSSSYTVFYEYGTAQQTVVRTEKGAFVPDKQGTYTVVYVAKDRFGNEAQFTHKLICKKIQGGAAISLSFTDAADTLNPTTATEVLAGELNVLAPYQIDNVNANANGYCRTYAIFEGNGERVEIDASAPAFTFEHVGAYRLVIEYGDEFHHYVKEFALESKPSDVARIEAPILPEYFILNAKYTLDVNRVMLYDSLNKSYAMPEVYQSENGGEWSKAESFPTVKFTQAGSAKLQYRYNGVAVHTTEALPVVDVNFGNKLNLANYFQGSLDVTAEKDDIKLSVRAGEQSGEAAFINTLSYSKFALDFEIFEESSKYKAFVIELVDYYDRTNVQEIVFRQDSNGKTVVSHNGESLSVNFKFAGRHKVVYTNKAFNIDSSKQLSSACSFASDKMLVRFKLQELSAESTGTNAVVGIRFLNSQKMSNKGITDTQSATITLKDMVGLWEKDAVISFQYADVTDVLSPFVQEGWAVSVTDGNGQAVTDMISGKALTGVSFAADEFRIKLESYGTYKISFQYTDQAGNRNVTVQDVFVLETQAPELTLSGINDGGVVKAGVGLTVKLFDYTVSDNVTAAEELKVNVTAVLPSLRMVHIKEDMTLTLERAGTYTVYYTTVDGAGNMTMVRYTIVAE